ncbi:MAG: NAD(+) synthase [Candidatus Eremiobacteraeota bacterium]|nr:NAD(+) synthase [Candidatus Eremiobacteraeota bacterium]
MKLIKVAAATLNQTPLDWEGNRSHIAQALEAAREERVSVLCLPEMCLSGYGCEDAFHSPSTSTTAWGVLQELLPATAQMVVSFGLPIWFRNAIYNAACLVVDGQVRGFVAKQYLAGDGIHYEPRWFKPWPDNTINQLELDGQTYPIGDLIFDVGGIRVGFEICEDAWVAQRPGGHLARQAVDVILNPSASHFAFAKQTIRERFVVEGSRAFSVAYIYTNLVGNEAGRAIYDGGAMVASGGRLLACGRRFSFEDWDLTTAVVDIERNRVTQGRTVSYIPDLADQSVSCVPIEFEVPQAEPEEAHDEREPWERGPHAKEEEFTRAITLGLLDYMRKSWSRGFVVSLSGGADSAACATLVALMVEMARQQLGEEGMRARLRLNPEQARAPLANLLTCVYQATRNSGEVTRSAASGLAKALGATYMEFDVDQMVEGYKSMVAGALGRELSWETDDLALQNIQARVRSPGVWMLANIKGALLVSTSNRSEAAVGYATMDGDTSGGLSPIAGIDKAFLRRWLEWMESVGPTGLGPVAALHAINAQAPTAELRPQAAGQTDEDDLMPYPILDRIEKAAIRDKETPLAIYHILRFEQPELDPALIKGWIRRFFTLWCRNQWKRERYAPSFHVDDANLDPKTWCRFPILSGGYVRELRALDEA